MASALSRGSFFLSRVLPLTAARAPAVAATQFYFTSRFASTSTPSQQQDASSSTTSIAYDIDSLGKIVKSDKVVVFMKGVPDAPRCGFSNAVVQVLRMHGVPFQSHDVLSSPDLRKAIKDFTSWPTIPQIFIDGEFIGGCDILLEKHQNGELIEDLLKVGLKSEILKEAQQAESAKQQQQQPSPSQQEDNKKSK